MIRVLFGSAATLIGVAMSAALFGPDLIAGSRGDPMVVAPAPKLGIVPASFDGPGCPRPLLLSDTASAADPTRAAAVATAGSPPPTGAPRAPAGTLVLLLGPDGHVEALPYEGRWEDLVAAMADPDCGLPASGRAAVGKV